jgi:hypothetical protein
VNHEKLFTGQLPTRLIVGCVENTAFNGDVTKNPFNFKHFSLNEVMVYLDGQQLDIKPLSSNFARGQYISAFISLFNGTGKSNRDEGNDIDRSYFANGYTLYASDLSPDLSENDHFNVACQGTVRLDPKFATALPHTVTVVAYAEFENIIEIDRNRNVIFDFNN